MKLSKHQKQELIQLIAVFILGLAMVWGYVEIFLT